MDESQDQERDNLDALKAVADQILEIALNCHFGALAVSSPKAQTKEQELLEWIEYEKWLKRQLGEYNQATTPMDLPANVYEDENNNENDPDQPAKNEEQKIKEREDRLELLIDQLKEELFQTSSVNSIQSKLLERIENMQVFSSIIFAQPTDSPDKLRLQNAVGYRDELVSEFLKEHDQLKKRKDHLENLRKENRVLKQRIRELQEQIDAMNKEKKKVDPAQQTSIVHKKKEELKNMESRNAILRNVIQNLVLESGVNWAEDEQLRDLMLKLENVYI